MDNSFYKVIVLLSTYNGAMYLREQLDSILNQKDVEVHLLVRDDGSKDSTCKILEEYSAKCDNIEWISESNVGFVKSFSSLVRWAYNYPNKADFYAFADQDDMWFPEKLLNACQALGSKDSSKPLLFTCNSIQIDAVGNELGLFHEGTSPVYRRGNVLVYGTEQGCSMTFNWKALEIYAAHEPQLTWHDRWMYHICYYLGDVVYEHQPLFYYRIHGGNTLANTNRHSIVNKRNRIVNAFLFYLCSPPFTRHQEMAKEFFDCFGSLLSERDRFLFTIYINYKKNILSKFRMCFSEEFCYPFITNDKKYPFRRFTLFNLL